MANRKTDIIYFLGAGFSAPFRIHTMKEMVTEFQKEIEFKHYFELLKEWLEKREKWESRTRWENETQKYLPAPKSEPTHLLFHYEYASYNISDSYKEEMERIEKEIKVIEGRHTPKAIQRTWTRLFTRLHEGKTNNRKVEEILNIETIISCLNLGYYYSKCPCLDKFGKTDWVLCRDYFEHMLEGGQEARILIDDNYHGLNFDNVNLVAESHLNKIRETLFEFIRRVCCPVLDKGDIAEKAKRFLLSFKNFNIDLFTTNYDFVVENLLWELKIPFERGVELNPHDGNTYFNFSKVLKSQEKVRLIKLHGSIDLYMLPDGRIIRSPIVTRGGKLQDGTPFNEMLIYPTEQKSVKDTPYRQMFNSFSKAVSQAKVIVFIGFNFNYSDQHIRKALEKGLSKNRQIKIIVVKEHPKETIKQLRKIKFLKRKHIKVIEGHLPKRTVLTKIIQTMGLVLKIQYLFQRHERFKTK